MAGGAGPARARAALTPAVAHSGSGERWSEDAAGGGGMMMEKTEAGEEQAGEEAADAAATSTAAKAEAAAVGGPTMTKGEQDADDGVGALPQWHRSGSCDGGDGGWQRPGRPPRGLASEGRSRAGVAAGGCGSTGPEEAPDEGAADEEASDEGAADEGAAAGNAASASASASAAGNTSTADGATEGWAFRVPEQMTIGAWNLPDSAEARGLGPGGLSYHAMALELSSVQAQMRRMTEEQTELRHTLCDVLDALGTQHADGRREQQPYSDC